MSWIVSTPWAILIIIIFVAIILLVNIFITPISERSCKNCRHSKLACRSDKRGVCDCWEGK